MSKNKKGRGSGTHGGGSKKKRRGAGSKGGRGNAGSQKHNKIKESKENPDKFGAEKGFKRPDSVQKNVDTINLKELDHRIDSLLEEGKVEKEDGDIIVDISDLGYDKLLGSGSITKPLVVKSENFSEKSKQKLEEAGGKAIELS